MLLTYLQSFIDVILHLDVHLQSILQTYDTWTYVILFLIIFLETGVVITPFLPGDSLLFAAGAFAALGSLNIYILFPLLLLAAILGDACNYHLGLHLGSRVFRTEESKLFNKIYLVRTEQFYERHGGKTIILARFIPIIRTFAPFVAGIGRMRYRTFLFYNVIGAALWCSAFLFGGYFFGNLQVVKENFSIVIGVIIVISIVPIALEILKQKWSNNRS